MFGYARGYPNRNPAVNLGSRNQRSDFRPAGSLHGDRSPKQYRQDPDIRTRAIFPEWAAKIEIRYVRPKLTENTLTNLLYNAGEIIGIGDDRNQKGGSYGLFELVNHDHPDFVRLLQSGGRDAQDEAIANPVCYDASTEELLSWFQVEVVRREKKAAEKDAAAAGRNNAKPRNRLKGQKVLS